MAVLTMAKAINDGLRAAMERDPKVLVMGEDVGKLGGVFRVTDGLQKDFGEQRVLDTPLAESGIIGTAVGLAIRGFRPVCEIQFDGFVFPGYDQIVSQLAKLHFRSQGRVPMPVVVKTRDYDTQFYRDMGCLDDLPPAERKAKVEKGTTALYGGN